MRDDRSPPREPGRAGPGRAGPGRGRSHLSADMKPLACGALPCGQMSHPVAACDQGPAPRNSSLHLIQKGTAGRLLLARGLSHHPRSFALIFPGAIGPHPFKPIQSGLNGRVYPIELTRDPLGSSQHQSGIGPKVMQMAPDPSPRMPASPRTKLRDVVATATPQRAIDEQKLAR
jgi:hypothetical protein